MATALPAGVDPQNALILETTPGTDRHQAA